MKLKLCNWFSGLICFASLSANSQSIPLGTAVMEDYLRRAQLTDSTFTPISFTVRPVQQDAITTDSIFTGELTLSRPVVQFDRKLKAGFAILPVVMNNEYNSHHPYGWNNGSLVRSRGLQTLLSGGVFAYAGPLRVQLKPELIFVENKAFAGFPEEHYDVIWERYYNYHYNRADLPESFGTDRIVKLLPGQSSATLNLKGLAVGVSTENIWWGPGRRNSLLMSNNARGFNHFTLHTTKPAITPIGSFEGQVIIGRLEMSGFEPPQPDREFQESSIYNRKKKDWRYLSGMILTYQPKWVNGLYIGGERTIQQYYKDTRKFGDYFPLFMNFLRSNDKILDDNFRRDQYFSGFVKWIWQEAHAEWYFEFGRNDASWNLRDFLMTPEHSRAYTFGLLKMSPLAKKDEFLQFHFEMTQLQQSVNYLVRDALNWYTHYQVRHGYTNHGEVLGAGIGPGSNVQFAEISWIKNLNKVGFQLERVVNNNDFYYKAYEDSKDFRRHWIDMGIGLNSDWQVGDNLLVSGKVQYIRTLNYWWYLEREPEDPYFVDGWDVNNLYATLNAVYFFR